MAYLVNTFPFANIIKYMKTALRITFVPGSVKATHGGAVADDVGSGDDFYTFVYLFVG